MKAKEYAIKYINAPHSGTLAEIMASFIMEIKNLIEIRNAKTDAALFAIFDELDNKWKAFVRETKEERIKLDAFQNVIRSEFPYAYDSWMIYRSLKRYG